MLRCHTRPCIRHVYIRHAQTKKSIIEQGGDMTTQPAKVELTEQGHLMAGSLVDGIRMYLQRKSCDPNAPINVFGGLTCDETSQECIRTFEAMKPHFPAAVATSEEIAKYSRQVVLYMFKICSIATIRDLLVGVAGISADNIGVPLASATIVDEMADGTCFVHAIGDLGIIPGYRVGDIYFWNNSA